MTVAVHAPRVASALLAGAAAGAMVAVPAQAGRGRDAEGPVLGVPVVHPAAPQARGYAEGVRLLEAGDVANALAAFRAGLAEDPTSVDLLNGMGVAYDRMGQFDLSASYYRAALALEPGSARTLNNRGYSLYLQGRAAEAQLLLERARDAGDPDVANAATRVLALIHGQAPAARQEAAPVRIAAAAARIERLNEGEVLLVLDAPASPGPVQLGEAASLTREARAWTRHEDEQPVAQGNMADSGTIQSKVAPAVAADRVADMKPAPLPNIVQATVAFIAASHGQPSDRWRPIADPLPLPAPPFGRPSRAAPDEVDRRRGLAAAPLRQPALGPKQGPDTAQQPPRRQRPLIFDSDNHRLNAFAARLHGVAPAPPEPSAVPVGGTRHGDVSDKLQRLQALSERLRG